MFGGAKDGACSACRFSREPNCWLQSGNSASSIKSCCCDAAGFRSTLRTFSLERESPLARASNKIRIIEVMTLWCSAYANLKILNMGETNDCGSQHPASETFSSCFGASMNLLAGPGMFGFTLTLGVENGGSDGERQVGFKGAWGMGKGVDQEGAHQV